MTTGGEFTTFRNNPGRNEEAMRVAIRAELAAQGITCSRMADLLDVTQGHMWMVLAGRRTSHVLLDDVAFMLGLIDDTTWTRTYRPDLLR